MPSPSTEPGKKDKAYYVRMCNQLEQDLRCERDGQLAWTRRMLEFILYDINQGKSIEDIKKGVESSLSFIDDRKKKFVDKGMWFE